MDCSKLLEITGPCSFTKVTLARLAVRVLEENQEGSFASRHFSMKAAG